MSGTASPLTALATVLQTMFLGSNKNETVTGTGSSRPDASIIDRLQGLFDEALANSSDPKAVQPIVNKILEDAKVAFAPQLGREAAAGVYNSTARQQMAERASADAAGAISSAVLNYKTSQQQVAAQAGNSLAANVRNTSNTGNQRSVVPPALGAFSNPAMLGLGAYSLYKQKDKIFDWLTGGSTVAGTAEDVVRYTTGAKDLLAPFNFMSGGAESVPAWMDITQSPDLYHMVTGTMPPFSTAGTAAGGEVANFVSDFGDFLPDFSSFTGNEVFDFAGLGDSGFDIDAGFIGDIFSGAGDFAGGIFDTILSFF